MADCSGLNPVFNAVGCTVQKVTDDGANNLGQQMMAGYDKILKDFATSWLGKGIMVDLNGPSAEWFKTSTSTMALFLVTMGLMVAGIQTFKDRNGRPAREVFEALGKVVFVTVAGSLAIQVFVVGFDAYGKWILDAAGLDTGTFTVGAAAVASAPGLAIIIGLFGILTVLCQWALMFIRGAILPLLSAFWPVVAAGAMLEGGKKGFEGITRWIIAFILYSPVAASIYALAWRMKNGDEGIGGVINGWILVVLAVLALPALLRLLAPVTSAMGKMAGAVMAMGMTAAVVGAGVAVGAAVATGGASAGASGAGAGAGAGAGTTGGGAATGGSSASGGAATGGDGATGGTGQSGKDGSSGSMAGGAEGSSSSTGGSSSGGGGSTAGGSSESSAGGSQSSGSTASGASEAPAGGGGREGSGLAFQAAQGALENSGGNEGAAEGMVSE
ncbi:hypothetical protein [Arthrobacter sp. M4]|uniref:hypothetical protein n=1 Tax=Arthrobacter sp. M4 TaxID=218160 RepID=UPI001CDC8194|nr:hypothetical protein [Arthrobacter sp. M4]MCA4135474.1 hypothetical protein [Arthrobacter sp. M4]